MPVPPPTCRRRQGMKLHYVVTNLPNGLAVALELITPDPVGTHAGRRPANQWCVGRTVVCGSN
jgi:hypothetical protein